MFTHDTSHVAPVLLAVSSMLLRLPLGLNGFLSVKSYFQSHLLGGPTVPTSIRATVDHYMFGFFWIIRVALPTVMFAGLSVRGLPPPAGRNGVDPERKAPCYLSFNTVSDDTELWTLLFWGPRSRFFASRQAALVPERLVTALWV